MAANAYTNLQSAFEQPAVNATVVAHVEDTAWMIVGQPVFVGGGGGFYIVGTKVDAHHVELENTGSNLNAAPAVEIPVGSGVAPGGFTGGGNGNVTHPGASVNTRIPVYASSAAGPGAALADSGFTIADLQATVGSGTALGTTVTASRNLASGDAGKLTECAHATVAIVLTIQLNATVALPIGHTSHWFRGGAALVSFAAVGGVTIVRSQSLDLLPSGMATLIKIGTDRFLLTGELDLT